MVSRSNKSLPVRYRTENGSLMPMLGVCVILLMGTLGIASDLMRNFQAVRELKYAAQQAALYGMSVYATATGGASQANVQNAILALNSNTAPSMTLTNQAQIGPTQGNTQWTGPVIFAADDIQFVQNVLDTNEYFLRLTVRRQGATSLAQFFLPLAFTGLNNVLPTAVRTFDTVQTVEALSQPATRIGPGPLAGQQPGTRAADFYQYAALPVAISSSQFASLAAAVQSNSSFNATLSFPSSTYTTLPNGAIPASFVNLTGTQGGTTAFANAQGVQAVAQLQNLLTYFEQPAGNPPAMVECGSQLSAYDPADPNFVQQQSQIVALVNNLPSRTYVLPVINGATPLLATSKATNQLNTVCGFAYVQLSQPQNLATQPFALNVTFLQSPPLRNASSAAGFASFPLGTTNLMPAPVAPFFPRSYDTSSGGVTRRIPGVAMAPALSPRPYNAQ